MIKLEKEWLDEISELGCIVCWLESKEYSPALIHHIRTWHGHRIVRNHKYVLPLCYQHHDAGIPGVSFHEDSTLWCQENGSQEELLNKVHGLLIERWKLSVYPSLKTRLKQFETFLAG